MLDYDDVGSRNQHYLYLYTRPSVLVSNFPIMLAPKIVTIAPHDWLINHVSKSSAIEGAEISSSAEPHGNNAKYLTPRPPTPPRWPLATVPSTNKGESEVSICQLFTSLLPEQAVVDIEGMVRLAPSTKSLSHAVSPVTGGVKERELAQSQ